MIATLPEWSARVVVERITAGGGRAAPEIVDRARASGREAVKALGPELRALLGADVDEQSENPMAVVRRAVAWPTALLRELGVAPVERDDYDRRHFPDDVYGITPNGFADLDPDLGEMGIVWGALKARAHLARHSRS